MKCSIFVCFFVFSFSAYCEGGALRCPPGVLDPVCMEEKEKDDTQESLSSGSTVTETQCLAGTEWESNCHYCRCSDTGIAECLKQDSCDKVIFAEPAVCKPNTTFQRDCNTCICLDNGLGLCTLESCRRSYKPVELLELSEAEESEKETTNNSDKSDVVVPGVDHIERHSVCRAQNTFYIGCNACHCNTIGTDYTCTNKRCPVPADVELFRELKQTRSSNKPTKSQVCVANRMFVKDCNTCWCNEDGTSYFCTRKVCVPLLPDEQPDLGGIPAEDLRVTQKQCQPDEIFEMDCNMCRCNPDGLSYACTRRACEEVEDKKKITLTRKVRSFPTSETQKTCQPGQEFRLDCNQCLCDNTGLSFSCTRNDCSSLNNHHASKREVSNVEPVEMKCVAGSVFNRECNVCLCTEDGNHATCTIKSCLPKNEVDSEPNANDPGFRCNAGEQFKRECNDCTCSADGKSIFCTIRLCDVDLAEDIETQSN